MYAHRGIYDSFTVSNDLVISKVLPIFVMLPNDIIDNIKDVDSKLDNKSSPVEEMQL